MKKWILGIVLACIPFLMFMTMIATLIGIIGNQNNGTNRTNVRGKQGLSEAVLQYESLVKQITEEEGIPEVANIILAMIEVESGGKGGDVMQSSESQGLPPNTITDPETSIRYGIQAFKRAYDKTKTYGMDVMVATAGYNYGNAFVDWLHSRGEDYSLENSELYSKTVVAPSLGNTTGATYSYKNEVSARFQKEYLYYNGGNFFYPELVRQYVTIGEEQQDFVPTGNGTYIYPFNDFTITSTFGEHRELTLQDGRFWVNDHTGVDFVPKNGNQEEPIHVIADGIVRASGERGGAGNMVVVQHEENLYTHYYHLSSIHVEVGQELKQGDIVGNMGSTGNSTGPHLHLGASTSLWEGFFDPMELYQ